MNTLPRMFYKDTKKSSMQMLTSIYHIYVYWNASYRLAFVKKLIYFSVTVHFPGKFGDNFFQNFSV